MITLTELLAGKGTIIKGKEYYPTIKYVNPFIEKMKVFTENFKILGKTPDQLTIGENVDLTFNKVLIEAKLDNKIDDLSESIFMAYALDVRKPVAKFYRSYIDEDNNLFVFDSQFQILQPVSPDDPLIHNVKPLMELTDKTKGVVETLKNTTIELNPERIATMLGSWIIKCLNYEHNSEFGKIKLSHSLAIDAYKLLFEDRSSKYYIQPDAKTCTVYDIYIAFSHLISNDDKDIINRFEKILLINSVLDIK